MFCHYISGAQDYIPDAPHELPLRKTIFDNDGNDKEKHNNSKKKKK